MFRAIIRYSTFVARNTRMVSTSSYASQILYQSSKHIDHYSSLYVPAKYGQDIFIVLKPSYDVTFLTFLSKNLDFVENLIQKRGITFDYSPKEMKTYLDRFIEYFKETNKLKLDRNRLKKKIQKKGSTQGNLKEELALCQQQLRQVRPVFEELEEKVVPFLLSIPNLVHPNVCETDEIMDELHVADNPSHLNYVRLGYFNEIYQSAIVGPNAHYLQGDGARIHHSLIEMASDFLEQHQFTQVNGLDLVKSALVEAVNSKKFSQDPYMLRVSHPEETENQRLHLVGESSLESLCALLCRRKFAESHLYQVGSSYDGSLEQRYKIRASVIAQFSDSDQVMHLLYDLWWRYLAQLELRCRSVRCGLSSLHHNQYAKYDLLVWMYSSHQWVSVASVCHYHHYITQRLGMANYHSTHLVSSALDLTTLFQCIVEQHHDPTTGKLTLPKSLVP